MSGVIDKVLKLTIKANSTEEAKAKAKSQQGVKNVLNS